MYGCRKPFLTLAYFFQEKVSNKKLHFDHSRNPKAGLCSALPARRFREVSLLETKKGKCSWPPSGPLGWFLQIKDVNRYPDSPHGDTTTTPGLELYLHENSFVNSEKVCKVTACLPVAPQQVSLTSGLHLHKIYIFHMQQWGIKHCCS